MLSNGESVVGFHFSSLWKAKQKFGSAEDYQEPSCWIREARLTVRIFEQRTEVRSRLRLERAERSGEGLALDGEELRLKRVVLAGARFFGFSGGNGRGCQHQWDPILVGIGEFTTHFRTYFSGDWDVHWVQGKCLSLHKGSCSLPLGSQRKAMGMERCFILVPVQRDTSARTKMGRELQPGVVPAASILQSCLLSSCVANV